MFCKSFCAAISGIDAHIVQVEADVADGLPVFLLVGYLNSEVREAKERVRGAIKNSGYSFPPKRITVNIAPADERKQGTAFDLGIATAILAAMGIVKKDNLSKILVAGEISLNGYIKPVKGILPIIFAAKKAGFRYCMIPYENKFEGSLVDDITVIATNTLAEAVQLINSFSFENNIIKKHEWNENFDTDMSDKDFSDIDGQWLVKKAAKIAAAGSHNMLMIGPPGIGKSMIAERMPGIMPALTHNESLEVACIYSVYNSVIETDNILVNRPFRNPHHSIPPTGLVGGGKIPVPGEISLAHKGILFLDELAEFRKSTLEMLRMPLEKKLIMHSRNRFVNEFPADFILIGAMNPCPCGFYPDRNKCICTEAQIRKYMNRLSYPFLDRFDIIIRMQPVSVKNFIRGEKRSGFSNESSSEMKKEIISAVKIQEKRYEGTDINRNSQISNGKMIEKFCRIDKDSKMILADVIERFNYSVRGYHKILKVARTIADLSGSDEITKEHVKEALAYRSFEREYFKAGGML